MLYTSYFSKIRKMPENVIPVAICALWPNWYHGKLYPRLAPKYDSLIRYKLDHDKASYIDCYSNTVLEHLDIDRVLKDLQTLISQDHDAIVPFWDDPDLHVALVCYEKPSDFCHRQIVADWIQSHGIMCEEWRG